MPLVPLLLSCLKITGAGWKFSWSTWKVLDLIDKNHSMALRLWHINRTTGTVPYCGSWHARLVAVTDADARAMMLAHHFMQHTLLVLEHFFLGGMPFTTQHLHLLHS